MKSVRERFRREDPTSSPRTRLVRYTPLRKASAHRATEKRLLQLWSLIVRLRDYQTCQKPGCNRTKGVQAHHIFGVRHASTRYDTRNGVALCSGHHRFWAHTEPEEFRAWIISRIGEDAYNMLGLRARARSAGRVDLKLMEIALDGELKRLGGWATDAAQGSASPPATKGAVRCQPPK